MVHPAVVTVNDYLAQRDAEWMGQIHRFLGLSVGLIQSGMNPWERKAAYACDITYSNNSVCGTYFLKNECNKSSLIIDSCRDRTRNKVLESFIINII
jgi:preprotein translocase subunit SecA